MAAVLFRGLLSMGATRRALREFAEPLDLLLSVSFVLLAMSLTGGVRSPFVVLLFIDLLLVRAALGVAATRFLTLVTLLGLAAMAGALWPAALGDGGLLGLAARVLWPLPVLMAMEVALPREAPSPPPRPPAPVVRTPAVAAAPAPPSAVPPPSAPPPSAPLPSVRAAAPVRPPASADAWGMVVHDLRSPLSVIRVYADLIAEQSERGEPARSEHLRNLLTEIDLMETLLGKASPPAEARASGATPAPPPARVDLVRLLGALAESYRLAHSERLRVEFVAERAQVPVAADAVALQRVFRNLLDNAVKFTPPGGRVRVRVGAEGAQAVVAVSDTGVGMTPEERERAFEYSFRGRAAQGVEGRGLGLGVSRELVEQSGGTIAISSEQGQGSDVTVRLPLAGAPRA